MRRFFPNAQSFHMLKNEHYVTFINSNRVPELIACEKISNFSSKEDGFHQRLCDKCCNSEARFSHFHYGRKGTISFKLRNYDAW